MKAVLCPVCCGSGRYCENPQGTSAPMYRACHGCRGSGWVAVEDGTSQAMGMPQSEICPLCKQKRYDFISYYDTGTSIYNECVTVSGSQIDGFAYLSAPHYFDSADVFRSWT